MDDYTSDWTYYKEIILNTTATGANISGDVLKFPALIRLTSSDFDFSQAETNGEDIRFSKSDDTHIAYEIERWDATGELAEIWVLIDTVYGNNNSQKIKMYWGNNSAADSSDGEAVFDTDNDFVAVYHFPPGAAAADTFLDATSNSMDGTNNGTDYHANGVIGNARTITGTANERIDVADNAILDLSTKVSISTWYYLDAVGDLQASASYPVAKANGSSTASYSLRMEDGDDSQCLRLYDGSNRTISASANSVKAGEWVYVMGTFDTDGAGDDTYIYRGNATDGFSTIYNGDQSGTIGNLTNSSSGFMIGGISSGRMWDGELDEVRVSDEVRSADWARLCYENQKPSPTLTEAQSAVTQGAALAADYEKAVRFTFSTTSLSLSADVANIPLLLRIDGDDIDFSVTKDDGSDLLFLDSADQPLYHEVVHWDKGNDSGLVWVKESNMENADGDFITMYYGCSDCSNSYADADNVWSDYTGVWHLDAPEDYSDDKTSNSNDGTYSHSMPFSSGVTTVFAPAFNGSSNYINLPASLVSSDNGSISLWLKTSYDHSNLGMLFYSGSSATGDGNGSEDELHLHLNSSDNLEFFIEGNSSDVQFSNGSALNDGNWYYCTATWDITGNAILYVNGASANSATHDANNFISDTRTRIGSPAAASRYFNGTINHVRLTSSVLTPDFIELSYENQKLGSTLYSTGDVTGPVPVAGLKLWLKADAGVEEASSDAAEDGDAVLNWLDQANSNDAAQSTSGNRPTYQADEINGLPVIRFDGSNDYMTVSMAQAQPMTIFLVMAAQSYTTGADDALWWFDDASGARLFVDDSDNDYVKLYDGTSTLSAATAVNSSGILYTAILNGSGSAGEIFLDGTSKADGGTGTDALAATFYLGSDNAQTANMHLDGDIAEILVYNSALGNTDRTMVTNYLMEKYGLGPPNNASTLTATGGSGKVDLSWTRPVSIDSRVDTVGIWAKTGAYPDSSRNGMLVGYFSTDDSSYTWNTDYAGTWYFTLLTRDSNGVWSNTTDAAQDNAVSSDEIKFTFDTSTPSIGTVTDFPMLIRLTSADAAVFDACPSADGTHLRFYDDDGATSLDFEVERWDADNDLAEIWVLVPQVDGNSTSDFITMQYTGCSNSDGSSGSSVFSTSNNFLAVWHLSEDGSTTADAYKDATSNGNHGTGVSMTNASDVACVIGTGQDFDGSNDYIEDADAENFIDGLSSMTISTWIQSAWTATDRGFIHASTNNSDDEHSLRYDYAGAEGGGSSVIKSGTSTTGGEAWIESSNSSQTTSWQFVAVTWTSGSVSKLYLDGSEDTPTFASTAQTGTTNGSSFLRMGYHGKGLWDGKMDEVRISNTSRSADWIKLCYHTQKENATLVSHSVTQIIYVDSAIGDDANSCSAAETPATAKKTVGSAASCAANTGVDTVKVVVMPGTYTDNSISDKTTHLMIRGADPNHPPILAGSSSGVALSIGAKVHLRNIAVRVATASDIGIRVTTDDDEVSVVGCRVYNNSGITMSKGIHIDGTGGTDILIANNVVVGGSGYAIDVESNTEVNIVNNVLTRASGTLNYGIYSSSTGASHISITNNIIRNADVGIYTSDTDDNIGLISHNLYFNVVTQTDGASGADDTDDSPVTGDPLFVSTDIENADAFKLLSGSPAIDAGTASLSPSTTFSTVPTEDLWGEDRTYGSAIDIGVYEGPGYSTQITGELDSLIITQDGGANTITIQTANWKIVFDDGEGGGIAGFYDMDNSGTNLLTGSNPLFDVSVGGTRMSSKTAYAPTLLLSNRLHATVRSTVDIDGTITANVTYNVYASGHIAVQSELRNTTGSASNDKQTIYYAELSSSTEWDNDGDEKGYGTLTLSNNRDLYAGVTTDLTQPSASTWTIASVSDQITWTSSASDIDFAANQRYQHHFLLYVGSESLDTDDAANIYSDAYAPSRLDVSSGNLTASESWQDFLKGQWPLNEGTGTTASDVSGNARNGTISGANWTSGKSSAGLNFDADNEKVTVSDHDDFEIGAGRTFMIWAYVPASWSGSEPQANLFSKWDNSGSTGWAVTRVSGSDKIQFQVDSYTAADPDDNPTAQWIHIAGVLTNSSVLELYVDGILKQRTTGVSGTANTQSVIIGDNGVANRKFVGQLDDARIYHQTMIQEQIQAIFNQGYSPKQGAHMVRANNNNRFITVMNPDGAATRFQPVFIIDNWYGDATPKYVYVDGVQMTPYTDFLSQTETKVAGGANMGNRLEIQFNRTFSEKNVDIFISNSDSSGFMGVSNRMKQLNTTVTASDKITVKNTTETTFGDAGSNQWQLVIDLDASAGTTDGDGGINEWYSSEVSSNTAISSAADFTGSGPATLDQFHFDAVATSGDEWTSGNPGSTYSISDSSTTRLKVSMGSMVINGGTPDVTLSRTYTIYPTGRIFVSHSITSLSAQPTTPQIYLADFTNMSSASDLNSAANAATNGRMGKLYDGSTPFHGFGVSALTVKSDGSTVTGATAIGTATLNSTNMALNFTNSYFQNTDPTITVNYMIDFAQNYSDANTLDSVLADVQDPEALTAIVGTAVTSDAMDFNTDGFAEGEGVYTFQASSGIANFSMDISPARFYPAFKITSWNVGILPAIVLVDNQEKVLGYHFNASVVGNDRELIIQFNEVYRPTATKTTAIFYIAQQDGLAVTLTEFRAIPGVGVDTLRWTTESEVDNLGFYLLRRIKPCSQSGTRNIQNPESQSAKGGIHNIPRKSGESADSAALNNFKLQPSSFEIRTSTDPSTWTPSRDTLKGAPPYILPGHCVNAEPLVVAGLAKLQGGAAAFDTSWKRVTPRLIPGPEDGRSGSTRNYQFVDRTAKFGITYQYLLVSVDFNDLEKQYGPVEATPINPLATLLYQNSPNPFNPSTSIRFDLKEKAPVTINIYNVKGRLIRRLVKADKPLLPGQYRYIWDAKDDNGRPVASGHYIYFLVSKNYKKAKKMTLLK